MIFVCEGCEKPAAGCEIFRKSILRPFRASAGKNEVGKWIPRADKHLSMESELVLGAPGQVLGEVGGVEQKYPSPFTDIKGCVRDGGLNVKMLVGGREEVGAGAGGRCCVLVWCLVAGCVVALIGGGCGPFGRKADFCKIRWKTVTCPGPV